MTGSETGDYNNKIKRVARKSRVCRIVGGGHARSDMPTPAHP
ncbi:hypothetical protein [Burkholderia thailandensis]|nr:hypothetical protein [Burkholderia thailandensis]MCS6517724.1 hypothetical protein [Burkholderia thailandensis]